MNKIFLIFNKLKFFWRKPKVILVAGKERKAAKEAIYQVLKSHFRIGKEILIFDADLKNKKEIDKFKFLAEKSPLFVLAISRLADNSEERKNIEELVKTLPPQSRLVLNFDDQQVREIESKADSEKMTFGFEEGADLRASDINLNGDANFKINYKGNTVPVWLEKVYDKEQIYSVLAAVCVATILDLNLVETSQALKNYRPIPQN